MRKSKRWSYMAGERGRNRCRVYEETSGGRLFIEFYELDGRRKRLATGHRDKRRAKRKADETAAPFGKGQVQAEDVTLGTLFDNYLSEVTPVKSRGKQRHDLACAEMFQRLYGANRKARTLNRRDWDRFITGRREGTIRPAGSVRCGGVRNRQIEYDLRFLVAVLNWATKARDRGEPLLDRNPFGGLTLPTEKSPQRCVMTQVQYRAMRSAAETLDWRFQLALVIVHETGHRIGAVRNLRWSDIDLEGGWIRWRAESDKISYEHRTPLTAEAVTALVDGRRKTNAIGEALVFPSPDDPDRPCSRHIMRDWWRRAQKQAQLTSVPGLGWHSLRRKFGNDLKASTPLKDLAALGGWKDHNTIIKCYQQADEPTMRAALERRRNTV